MSATPPSADPIMAQSPRVSATIVLFTMEEQALKVLTVERSDPPYAGCYALPGDTVRPGETLEQAASRVLIEQAGLLDVAVEQLHTFSALDRDPTGWTISTAYLALAPYELLEAAAGDMEQLRLPHVESDAAGKTARLRIADQTVEAGFDHALIISTALERLRGKLDGERLPFALLPRRFTLFELQQVHECILGRPLNKPQFRKKWHGRTLADGSRVKPTGQFTSGRRHRPAELYRVARATAS